MLELQHILLYNLRQYFQFKLLCLCFDNIKVLVYTQSYGGQVVVLALGTQSEPNSEERSKQKCEQIWQVP